jgi:hypothetical protein
MLFKCTKIFPEVRPVDSVTSKAALLNQLWHRKCYQAIEGENTMITENNSPDTQEQQDDANALETAERKRLSRLANEFAKRAKERQLRYDEGHNIFTK